MQRNMSPTINAIPYADELLSTVLESMLVVRAPGNDTGALDDFTQAFGYVEPSVGSTDGIIALEGLCVEVVGRSVLLPPANGYQEATVRQMKSTKDR
jgi:hypothetical protein